MSKSESSKRLDIFTSPAMFVVLLWLYPQDCYNVEARAMLATIP